MIMGLNDSFGLQKVCYSQNIEINEKV